MPRPGIWKPTVEPATYIAGSGLPISAPVVWQPPQSMMLARYSPRFTLAVSAAASGEAASRAKVAQGENAMSA